MRGSGCGIAEETTARPRLPAQEGEREDGQRDVDPEDAGGRLREFAERVPLHGEHDHDDKVREARGDHERNMDPAAMPQGEAGGEGGEGESGDDVEDHGVVTIQEKEWIMQRWLVRAAVAVLFLGVSGIVRAQDSADDRIRALEQKIAEQQKVLDQQARAIEELRQALVKPDSGKKPEEATPVPPGEAKTLSERLDAVENRTKHLADPARKEVGVGGFFRDGLKFKSADDNFTLDLGGRVIVQSRTFTSENAGDSTFFNRETYLQAEGTFYKQWGYRVQYDIAPVAGGFANENGSARLREGWVDWRKYPAFGLKAGLWKEPFSVQQLSSSAFIDLIERSAMDRLTPSYDVGVAAYGKPWDPYLSYEVGVFNGNGYNTRDNNDDKDVAARIVLKPFGASEDKWAKGLQLGLGFTEGNCEGTFGNISSPSTGTSFLQTAAATQARGGRTRWGGDLVYAVGPFRLMGEYVMSEIELRSRQATLAAQRSQEIKFDSWYVQALYVLTGEEALMARRKPATRFLEEGGWGQWEIALRYGRFDVEDSIFDTVAAGGQAIATKTGGTRSTGGLDEYAIGLNWWANPNVRVSLNWVRNEFDDKVGFGTGVNAIDSEDAVLLRFQLDF